MTTPASALTSPAAELPYGIAPPGYRLPAATRLGRVRLQVADLARSLAYYAHVLGLRTLARTDASAILGAPAAADADGAAADVPLVELHARPGARPVPRRGLLGLYHFAVLLPERAALARFVRHLAAQGVDAGMSDHLVSEAVYLQDPDGLGIEVYADRPRNAWRHHARELQMTTAPLDVRDLMRAAQDAPDGAAWAGMPAGTVIGHVHLHVGDVERATEFYHAALGFDRVVWSYPGALFLSAGGYHHHLGTNTWAAHAPPAGENDARLLDWEVVVPTAADADAAAHSVRAAGHAVEPQGPGAWHAADAWGTRVRVVSDRAR